MIIDGKLIAEHILGSLTKDVSTFRLSGINPTLAVILVGDDPASLAYIKQKQKAAEKIGAAVLISNSISDVKKFNDNPNIHGIIVQRPVPKGVGEYHVVLSKDVDGFEPNTPFDVPVALAVWELLKSTNQHPKKIVVVGRGETAGAPILRYLEKQHFTTSLIHSQTPNPDEVMKQADVIISCVGKERVVSVSAVKPGAILISVGIWRDTEGKLRGDYEESEIADSASWYTPTPGGVGPVNVACLMQNLIKACKMKQGGKL